MHYSGVDFADEHSANNNLNQSNKIKAKDKVKVRTILLRA